MKTKKFMFKEIMLSSAQIEVPRGTYQRKFNARRALKIAEDFDERIANEPKVSYEQMNNIDKAIMVSLNLGQSFTDCPI
jgi:hypothetical protein